MFFFEFVVTGFWRGITPSPELLDESFLLFGGLKLVENRLLIVGDGIDYIFLEPLFEIILHLLIVRLSLHGAKKQQGYPEKIQKILSHLHHCFSLRLIG